MEEHGEGNRNLFKPFQTCQKKSLNLFPAMFFVTTCVLVVRTAEHIWKGLDDVWLVARCG
jgi:hypothetical protein